MSHRSNLTLVSTPLGEEVPTPDSASEKVIDPICGREIDRKSSKNVIFRGDATYYFCCRECQTQFIFPQRKEAA